MIQIHEQFLEALSRHTRVVWVEDEITSEALNTLFYNEDRDWRFPVAGSWHGVSLLVQDAVRGGKSIFGIIDKDYRSDTNESAAGNIFVLPRHEIENFLLDPQAIAASRDARRVSPDKIKDAIIARARESRFAQAVNATLFKANPAFWRGFPGNANIQFDSVDNAADYIVNHSDWNLFCRNCEHFSDSERVRQEINDYLARIGDIDWENDRWRKSFEGKRLLKAAKSVAWKSDAQYSIGNPDMDFAKSICQAMIDANSIPEDLSELMEQIRTRAMNGS